MLITSPVATAPWAPRDAADWAPLIVSGAVLTGLLLALVVGDRSLPAPPKAATVARETSTFKAPPQSLRTAPPRVEGGNLGSIRLVATRVLPPRSGNLASSAGCTRAPITAPSPAASAAISAGWHVGADLYQSGYQIVLVDAGFERQGKRCVPVGASALVFTQSGLVAIAYDRDGNPDSRLAEIETTGSESIRLSGGAGALAHLALGDRLSLR